MVIDMTRAASQRPLEGETVTLRRLGSDDVTEAYLNWLNDPQVNRFLETRHQPQSLQTIRDFVDRVNTRDDEFLFGIILRADGRHVGNIKVGPIKKCHALADVSLLVGERDCWGRGVATDAIRAISRFSFDTLSIKKLSASMYADNIGSIRAFLRVGYLQEGFRRNHYQLDGKPTDIVELGLCAGDLRS